ncbi:hypothetical protein BU15DRAFT_52641 [Melanogaster broomeanus]|nr:hypothetical protein BU15DRAFT_52641 [Melanogaster broomeanus]
MRCSRCKSATYCSNECQTSDWPYHKMQCSPTSPKGSVTSGVSSMRQRTHTVMGVTIACDADRARGARAFEARIIHPSHAIYTRGLICPLFQQVGFPLILCRHLTDDPSTMLRDPGLDNQIAAHLMTHPSTGQPQDGWQRAGCLGTVTVMRQDGKPLTFEAIETALMYVDHILGLFHDGRVTITLLNPCRFQRFCQRYKDERTLGGYSSFHKMILPFDEVVITLRSQSASHNSHMYHSAYPVVIHDVFYRSSGTP